MSLNFQRCSPFCLQLLFYDVLFLFFLLIHLCILWGSKKFTNYFELNVASVTNPSAIIVNS